MKQVHKSSDFSYRDIEMQQSGQCHELSQVTSGLWKNNHAHMKRISLILFMALCMIQVSCKKTATNTKVVKVSYPTITLKGDKFVSLHVGEAYTDPGATGTDDISGATSDIASESSTLDVSTPGLYYTSYVMSNANGFITKAARYIAVTDYSDAVDLSGVYERTSNGIQVNLTKVARAMYKTDDMGGAGLPDAAYFAVINDSTIDLGLQLSESIGEEISGSSASLHIGATDTFYQYKLAAPGYGTAMRKFVKVE